MVSNCQDKQTVGLKGVKDRIGKLAQYELPDRCRQWGSDPGILLYQSDGPFDFVTEARTQATDL
jgi:hypothetical protein